MRMPDSIEEMTVVDVYDLASDIGKECEIIIERYGADAVTALLPKVINALEFLEHLAVRNEKENQELQDLRAKVSQLENDKIEKAEYRQRFEKEIEAIEEQWRTESAELVAAVSRLQDENKRLRKTISATADGSGPESPVREADAGVLARLAGTADHQRATLRRQEAQLRDCHHLIENLTSKTEKMAQANRELRRKNKQLQNQKRAVCEERAELSALVEAQQRDLAAIQTTNSNSVYGVCDAAEDGAEDLSRPAFSVREMRAILHERNELKLRLARLEERDGMEPSTGSDTSTSLSGVSGGDEEAEGAVEGPLPAEPDDAPWKRRQTQTGIRSFFRKLFSDSDIGMGAFARRSPYFSQKRPTP